jgi:uroporphyrinogen decarboxylase
VALIDRADRAMTSKDKRFLNAVGGAVTDRPPFWFMRQAGRYLPEYRELRTKAKGFLHFCYTPELAVEATLQPLRRYDPDAAILFSDILVVPDAVGCDVRFVEGEGPRLEPLRDAAAIEALSVERIDEHLAPVYEAVAGIKASMPTHTTLIGFGGAPWTLAVYMVEGKGGTQCQTPRRWGLSDPEGFAKLIDLLVDATVRHLSLQIDAGAEVVQLFDSWAGVLDAAEFEAWSIEPTKKIVAALKAKYPHVPVIGFPRLSGASIIGFCERTGVDACSLDSNVPIEWARDTLGDRVVLQGNLDNQRLVIGGDGLDAAVARILDAMTGKPFIFNLGHGVVPETPPEHVARVVELIKARGA